MFAKAKEKKKATFKSPNSSLPLLFQTTSLADKSEAVNIDNFKTLESVHAKKAIPSAPMGEFRYIVEFYFSCSRWPQPSSFSRWCVLAEQT